MGRKPFYPSDAKFRIVLSVLRGEMTQVEAARQRGLSQTTIAKWQKQFLSGAQEGVARGDAQATERSKLEEDLQSQVADLTMALGEANVELRVWRKKGGLKPFQPGPS